MGFRTYYTKQNPKLAFFVVPVVVAPLSQPPSSWLSLNFDLVSSLITDDEERMLVPRFQLDGVIVATTVPPESAVFGTVIVFSDL